MVQRAERKAAHAQTGGKKDPHGSLGTVALAPVDRSSVFLFTLRRTFNLFLSFTLRRFFRFTLRLR